MRTLNDIRSSKENNDILFLGMEENPEQISSELLEHQKKYYQDIVKPTFESVFNRQINN